jgi:hypothetical protein
MKNCKSVSDHMQTEDLDLGAASITVADLTSQLNVMRSDEECCKLYDKTLSAISEMGKFSQIFLETATWEWQHVEAQS